MSLLDRLDATRICARWSPDPTDWALTIPMRQGSAAVPPDAPFSWRALARNPRALVVTGVFGPLLAADSVLRGIAGGSRAG